MSRFTILISDTQATAVSRGDVGPIASGVRFTTVLPGGCGTLSFNVPADPSGPVIIPSYLGFNYQVRVIDEGEVIWIGRLEDFSLSVGSGGRIWSATAYGYGVNLSDDYYTTSPNLQNTETSTIISNAIAALAPQIAATSITATGFTISNVAAVNLNLVHGAGVIAWAARYGDVTTYNPQNWTVYPDSDGTVRFTFADRPTTVQIEGHLSDFDEAKFGLKGRLAANKAIIRYNNGSSYASENDSALQGAGPDGWNLTRAIVLVLPEISQPSDATQAANTLLTTMKALRMTAESLSVKANANFDGSNGEKVRPWRLRAGQLFQLHDVDPSVDADSNLAFLNSFVIAGTDWDEDSQTLTLTPESYETVLERAVATVTQVLSGRLSV